MTKNNINKKIIETLTVTHQQPKTAYIAVLNGCKTQEEKQHIIKIAKKYSIDIKKEVVKMEKLRIQEQTTEDAYSLKN